jgi:RNA polymerase sigma-70 factor, ECF subfamily
VIELNAAVAAAMADGPEAGLASIERLEEAGALARYHLLPAAKADLLRRLGRLDEAAVAYNKALALATNPAEKRYLEKRLAIRRPARSVRPASRAARVSRCRAPPARPPPDRPGGPSRA